MRGKRGRGGMRSRGSEEHTSELQSQSNLVCRLLLEKKIFTNAREPDAALMKNFSGKALFFTQQPEQQGFCADVFISKTFRLFGSVVEHERALVSQG